MQGGRSGPLLAKKDKPGVERDRRTASELGRRGSTQEKTDKQGKKKTENHTKRKRERYLPLAFQKGVFKSGHAS